MTNRPETSTAPTSTTNITGLRAIVSGLQLHERIEQCAPTSARSQIEAADERMAAMAQNAFP